MSMLPGKRLTPARFLATLGALILTGTIAAGCGATVPTAEAAPIRLVDDTGSQVVLKHPAHRLVVLEPSNFEIVDALGLRSRIVGVDASVPDYVPAPWRQAAQHLPSLGSVYGGVSAEKVAALRPDLVIAAGGLSGLSAVKALHIPVLVLEPTSIAGIYHDIILVGEATGRTEAASALVARLKAQVAAIEARVTRVKQRPTVFYDLGQLYTAGPHSFINSLIDLAGGINIGAKLSNRPWPQVSDEAVVAANPDYIIVDPEATTPAAEAKLPGFAATRAGKAHHIVAVPNSSYIDEPSPGFVLGLRELIEILHPGLLK